MNTRNRIGYGIFVAVVLSLFFSGCQKKQPPSPSASKEAAIREQLKSVGLGFYPKAQILDQAVSTQYVRKPGSEKSGEAAKVSVVNIWQATDDSVETVRAHYISQAPHVLTEEKQDGEVAFLQLCSVSDIGKVIAEAKDSIILIDIRKRRLTDTERAAYQNELAKLKKVSKPDFVQKRRMQELERYLLEKTLVQTKLRTVRSETIPIPSK
ncbi:MAG TPA: hypothetical protein PKL97_02775 [Candidatus Omnitrophota bacterium]|nr:hypothetical protein [Candidatus Omnitrophota bacterium]